MWQTAFKNAFFITLIFCANSWASSTSPRYEKLNAVLEHLNAYDSDTQISPVNISRDTFEAQLTFIDPSNTLRRYLKWNNQELTLFKDRDTRTVKDISIKFTYDSQYKTSLQGLRVACDPGHMGGPRWDARTLKFVSTTEGYVSEGTIALQTCLLLSQKLKELGAEVALTRTTEEPVTSLDPENFDLTPFVSRTILSATDSSWFDNLLSSYPLGNELFSAAEQHPRIQRFRSEQQRESYFIHNADLLARAEAINQFNPHIVIIIHFDAANTSQIQNNINVTRGYVHGNIMTGEAASRESRILNLQQVLNHQNWTQSVRLVEALTKAISNTTGITILNSGTDVNAIRVNDGVYARNLALTRHVRADATAYMELARYDYAPEFLKLSKKDRETTINGVTFTYPSRLDDFVAGLAQGISEFTAALT